MKFSTRLLALSIKAFFSKHRLARKGTWQILLLLSVLPFSACSQNIVSWQEEVKLNDGRVITITQKRKCERVYDGHSVNPCLAREAWMLFTLPEFSAKPIEWHYRLSPLVLNVERDQLYVVAVPPTDRERIEWKFPKPGYVQFRFEGSDWRQIPFSQVPVAIYNTNLSIDLIPPEPAQILSVEQKNKFNAGPHTPREFQRIDPTFTD